MAQKSLFNSLLVIGSFLIIPIVVKGHIKEESDYEDSHQEGGVSEWRFQQIEKQNHILKTMLQKMTMEMKNMKMKFQEQDKTNRDLIAFAETRCKYHCTPTARHIYPGLCNSRICKAASLG